MKDTPRGNASFLRTVRTALRRRGIDVPLRGHWCTLTTMREALAVCGTAPAGAIANAERAASPRDEGDDHDVRVVALG